MPARSSTQRNLPDLIDELKKKIQLVDGEREAYNENAKKSIQKNKETISVLKKENDELRKDNAERLAADEKVVKTGLKENPEESRALQSKPGDVAIVVMDEKVGDKVNALNAARHVTRKKQAQLESLKKRQNQKSGNKNKGKENEGGKNTANDDDDDDDDDGGGGVSRSNSSIKDDENDDDAAAKRNIENRLDKSNLKCKEAEHIKRTYQQIKAKLENEQQTFEQTLDDLQREIKRMKDQKIELKRMKKDAEEMSKKAKEDLADFEKQVHRERRSRAEELEEKKRERQEQDFQQRKRTARLGMVQDTLSDQKTFIGANDDEQEQMRKYEAVFGKMKQAAGVSDTRELVQRFRDQGEKQADLKNLMAENDEKIKELTEEKEQLQKEYNHQKYTGEAKITSGEEEVAEAEQKAFEAEVNKDEAYAELEKSSKLLTGVKSGVEHLMEKLKGFKEQGKEEESGTVEVTAAEESETGVQLLNQIQICDYKVTKLLEELGSVEQTESELSKKMTDEEFVEKIELRLPDFNTRVKLPAISRERDFGDDNLSGDEAEPLTRQMIKKQSQMIIDSKTRRRPNKKKKRMGK